MRGVEEEIRQKRQIDQKILTLEEVYSAWSSSVCPDLTNNLTHNTLTTVVVIIQIQKFNIRLIWRFGSEAFQKMHKIILNATIHNNRNNDGINMTKLNGNKYPRTQRG